MRLVFSLAALLGSVTLLTPVLSAQVLPGPYNSATGWNASPGYTNNAYAPQTNIRQPRQSVWSPTPTAAQQAPQNSSNFQYPSSLLEPFRANARPVSYPTHQPAINNPAVNNSAVNHNGWQDPYGGLNPPAGQSPLQPQPEQLPASPPNYDGSGMQQPMPGSNPGMMGWQGDPNMGQGYGYADPGNAGYGATGCQNCGNPGCNGGCLGGSFNQAMEVGRSFFQPNCGDGCVSGSCYSAAPCCGPRGYWFGGIGGLIMFRDYESNVYLSYWPTDPRNNVMTSRNAELGSMGGYEASIGRTMCNGWAWMATYWGLAQDSDTASVGGMPQTRLMGLSYLNYTPAGFGGDNVYNWYNNAANHRIIRENEFHNLEINFFRGCSTGCGTNFGAGAIGMGSGCGPVACNTGPAWNFQWLAGARFFKFDEYFQYASSVDGSYTYMPRELYYDIETENNLVGFQLGGLAQRAFGRCWSLYAGTKMGIYNNRINYYSRIYGPSGDAVVNTGSYNGTAYNVRSTKDDLALLGELNVGARYQFARCWRATIGYRAIAATGIALAPNQIPYDFSYIPGVRYIDSDGSLILHGAYAGIEFRR